MAQKAADCVKHQTCENGVAGRESDFKAHWICCLFCDFELHLQEIKGNMVEGWCGFLEGEPYV